jgi:chaperonin cofactor prefoldin
MSLQDITEYMNMQDDLIDDLHEALEFREYEIHKLKEEIEGLKRHIEFLKSELSVKNQR